MTKRIRTAAVAIVGALGLLVAPIALAAPAAAVIPATNVLFFSNGDYTDPAQEDATQIAAIEAFGITVTTFDGGDGSDVAWDAALTGMDALVIPESDVLLNSPVMSSAAAAVIGGFVNDGGLLFLPTENQEELISLITGVDFTSVWNTTSSSGPWPFAGPPEEGYPTELGYSNGTYTVDVSGWGPDQFTASFPVYYNGDTDEAAIIGFPVGDGTIYTLAYDWYPGDEGEDAPNRAVWNEVLGLLLGYETVAPAPAPAPELAATGSSVEPGLYVGGAALLLLAGAAVVIVARRKAAA
ncbi:LPXTG cell wall anchor domain-containing protein [Schumannella luteola]